MKTKRWIYCVLLLLAMPAAFWTSFEMYVLTLSGQQMLFFSITHAFPIILLVVTISVLFFLLLAVVNIICIFSQSWRSLFVIPTPLVRLVLLFQAAHIFALFSYDAWSSNSIIRVSLCLVGIGYLLFVFIRVATWINAAQQGAPGTTREDARA